MISSISLAAGTHTGRVRKRNEDSVLAIQLAAGTAVLAVADGMGGLYGGHVASHTAISSLQVSLAGLVTSLDKQSWLSAFPQIFGQCNSAMRARADADSDLFEMGTTLTVMVILKDCAVYAHIGDSRVYRFRNGSLHQITADHNAARELADAGCVSRGRHVLTRWLGPDTSDCTPDMGSIALLPGDLFLLCSDGFYTMVAENALRLSLLQHLESPDQAPLCVLVENLIKAANDGGGRDNISVSLAWAAPGGIL